MIRQAFAYVHRFRGKLFVIHIDDTALDERQRSGVLRDIALLHQAGIRVVVVAGAQRRVDEVLHSFGVRWSYRDGIRVTHDDAIGVIKMAAFDVANEVMTLLSSHQTSAVMGNWVRAHGIGVIDGVDYGRAGVVERISRRQIEDALSGPSVAIVPSVGWSSTGKPYNLSSRIVAAQVAVTLEAAKLVFVTARMGVSRDEVLVPEGFTGVVGARLSRVSTAEAAMILSDNGVSTVGELSSCVVRRELDSPPSRDEVAGEESTPACQEALELLLIGYKAVHGGVPRSHIVDGRIDGAVMAEVFSDTGVGTMIYGNIYQSIRPLEGGEAEIVYHLTQPLASQGVLVTRTVEDIARAVGDYVVHETDGLIQGCGALHHFSNGEGEIAAIAVDPRYEEGGIGRKIVEYLVERARRQGLRGVFVLTTRTHDWFEGLGFVRVGMETLPAEKRACYNTKRNSIILRLGLAP